MALACTALTADAPRDTVDGTVRAYMHENGIKGLALGVQRGGHTLYVRGYGYAGEHPRRGVDEETVFPIASLTKSFTAAALRILERERGISQAMTLAQIFPEYRAAANVTLRELLEQTSGIPDYDRAPSFDRRRRVPIAPEALLDSVASWGLSFTPGSQFEYSNTNYLLAALTVQRVTKRPYAEFLQRAILQPLRLHGTHVGDGLSIGFGCADLVSTVADLLRWTDALNVGTIVPTPRVGYPYADGFFTGSDRADGSQATRSIRFADGHVAGYSSYMGMVHGLTVVILTNADKVDLGPLGRSVLDDYSAGGA